MIYEGKCTAGEMDWTVTVDGAPLDPRADLVNHSPDGFAWGYPGSGPAQLALAILSHHFQTSGYAHECDERCDETGHHTDWPTLAHLNYADHLAVMLHQDFKAAVIARLPMDAPFTLTTEQVEAAVKALPNALRRQS